MTTWLIMIVVGAFGVALGHNKVQLYLLGVQTTNWTSTVRGEVIESRVASWGRYKEFEPRIVYTYQVHGRNYTSSTFAIDWPLSVSRGYAWAEEFAKQYPVGSEVVVYYDPDDPSRAVLRRGPMSVAQLVIWFVASAVIAVFFPYAIWLFNAAR